MAFTLHTLAGSPFAWRCELALAHKRLPFTRRVMSYDAGDFRSPDFARLNPRRRVPVLQHGDFVLYESAAIVEYLEEVAPTPPLFGATPGLRALQRRMIREADQYVVEPMEDMVQAVFFTKPEERDPARIAHAWAAMHQELDMWEGLIQGDFLAGDLSAPDHALFTEIALAHRIASRVPGMTEGGLTGPRLASWYGRMLALPDIRATWPAHWGEPPGG
jgi:glutathione S-transferase